MDDQHQQCRPEDRPRHTITDVRRRKFCFDPLKICNHSNYKPTANQLGKQPRSPIVRPLPKYFQLAMIVVLPKMGALIRVRPNERN